MSGAVVYALVASQLALSGAQSVGLIADELDGPSLGLIQTGAAVVASRFAGPAGQGALFQNATRKPIAVVQTRTIVRATVGTRGVVSSAPEVLSEVEGSGRPHRPNILKKIKDDSGNTTAAEILSVKRNSKGDLQAFLSSLAFDSASVALFLLVFSILRRNFRPVYAGNWKSRREEANGTDKMGEGLFEWISATFRAEVEDLSLDALMAVRFHEFCIKLCITVGAPMCLVMCPLHYWCGNMPSELVDPLSRVSMANIRQNGWLYFVHALVVWLVVVHVERSIYNAMEQFLEYRFRWLKSMPEPRSTTVMIENIPSGPDGYCSDDALAGYITRLVPHGAIKAVHVVRRTDHLLKAKAKAKSAELMWRQAEAAQRSGKNGSGRQCCGVTRYGDVERYREEMEEAMKEVHEERRRLLNADPKDEDAYSTTAFVTFQTRQYAEIALRLQFTAHADEFVMSIPPEPSDIRWADLEGDATREVVMERIGYLCVIGLYIGFMPITVTISSITNLEHLREHFPPLDDLLTKMPVLAGGLEGILASFALTLFLSFLPSILMVVFDRFFVLRADAWAQHKLQNWYFWFQVVFVLLVTIVGNSVIIAFKQIAEQPFAVFGILADSMPSATHFYLNFLVMQWVTQAMNLTRYMNLIKYVAFLPVLGEQRAKELCEPEDQDYYGFGSRSARWTINMVIVLVFCQISPLISLTGLVCFLLCRLVYGYLLVHAEDPKPDLGGVFFVQQLVHLQKAVFIYLALMTGVLFRRSDSYVPVVLAVGAIAYMAYMYNRFHLRFGCWHTLPFQEVVDAVNHPKRVSSRESYVHPELEVSSERTPS